MNVIDAIRRANQPGPPENSIRLRVACTTAVLVSITASAAEHEVSFATALVGELLVLVGMAFSYRTRERPPTWIKVLAAVAAVSVLVWFFHQLTSGPVTDITAVEDPLTVMFISIQAIHSFHVPARRDLVFSIVASGALIAVAAAQAIDLSFALYAAVWLASSLWALVELWRSASGGGTVSVISLGTSTGTVLLAGALLFLLLPAPVVSVRISFQSRASGAPPVPVPGALAGDSGSPSQLSKPGSRSSRARVGGYLGFANSLDTALRGNLGGTLVMRVRAQRPSYWIGETFDTWDGQNWLGTKTTATHVLRGSSPYEVPLPAGDVTIGQPDLQTFYIASPGPDLVFHADAASQVWFPASSVFFGDDGTLVSPIGLGKGAIYTVESSVAAPTGHELQQDVSVQGLGGKFQQEYTELPHAYPEAAVLAKTVTAGAATTYDKVESLINWIGFHTRYSTNIPPLPAGTDTVNEFLFGNRVGFCEQISTSLAVMLRTLGIPAREVVGYVPDSYNPITDLYDVRAKDAHAWVQVWFPGYGWQSFDPTSVVPLANPSPGGTALKDLGHALSKIPWVPLASVLGALGAGGALVRWRKSRPETWTEAVARHMDHAGRRAKRPRKASETLIEYGSALDDRTGDRRWSEFAQDVTAAAYGASTPSQAEQQQLVLAAKEARKRMNFRAKSRATNRTKVLMSADGGFNAIALRRAFRRGGK